MPGVSTQLCDKDFLEDLKNIVNPKCCFDIGVGEGKIGKLIKSCFPDCKVIGFEIFKSNIKNKNLDKYYDYIFNIDFYEWIQENVDWSVDLIVFGDVLEHFFKSKVFDILDMCKTRAKWIIAEIPLNYKQNILYKNINEAHLSENSLRDLNKYDIYHYVKVNAGNFFMTYYLIRGDINLDWEANLRKIFEKDKESIVSKIKDLINIK